MARELTHRGAARTRAPHDLEMDLCPPTECFMIFNGTLVLRVSAQAKAHTPQDPRCRTGPCSSGGQTQPSPMTALIIRIMSRAQGGVRL